MKNIRIIKRDLFIEKFMKKGLIEELRQDIKRDIKAFKSDKSYHKTRQDIYNSNEILRLAFKLTKLSLKNQLRFISKATKKAIAKMDLDKIAKTEKVINLYLKTLQPIKQEYQFENSNNKRYKLIYIKSKKAILNHILKYYNISNNFLNKNRYLIKLYLEILKAKTCNYKGKKNQVKFAYYKSLKNINKTITKQVKKGYEITYNNDFLELQALANLLIIEYIHKYNNVIVMNSRLIKNRIARKISYSFEKSNIVNYKNISFDSNYYNSIITSLQDFTLQDKMLDNIKQEKLTSNQVKILNLKNKGYTFKEIANLLDISISNAKMSFYRITEKVKA